MFSQLAVTSRSTRCIVSVPIENFIAAPTQQDIMLIMKVVTKILSIYTSQIYILWYPNYPTDIPTIEYLHMYMYATCKYSSNHN